MRKLLSDGALEAAFSIFYDAALWKLRFAVFSAAALFRSFYDAETAIGGRFMLY